MENKPVLIRRKKPKKHIKVLDVVLVLIGIYVIGFVIATIIIYTTNGWPYDALFPYALGIGGIEGLCSCAIQISKYKRGVSHDDNDGNTDNIY